MPDAITLQTLRGRAAALLADIDALLSANRPPAADRFRLCLPETLKHEGGYVNHPRDPGGATNLGVTLGTAKAAGLDLDGDGDVDEADIRRLTPERVEPVYRERYWRAAGCPELPAGVDLMVFDAAVNSGPARAVRMLQTCLGLAADGAFGPLTRTALAAAEPASLIRRYAAERERFLRSLPTFDAFGEGWMRRVRAVTAKALEQAR